jgi:hypothetical protein
MFRPLVAQLTTVELAGVMNRATGVLMARRIDESQTGERRESGY